MVDASGPQTGVQIQLLGPLEIRIDGRVVPAGGPRQRALLALLALSVGIALPPSQLVDLLWDEAPPPTAVNTVQVYVSRLRRLFTAAGAAGPLHSVSGAYLLDLPAEAVDVGRFETLSERGRARLAAGGTAAAADDLHAALAVWRGTALPDLAGTVVARAAIARLESMRLAVLADRIDADAQLGRHQVLIPELEGLVRQHPLDERFVGQLMAALYRAGRQAEAFAAYTTASGRLAEELGVDPGPALRAVHSRILHQDADLDRPPERGTAERGTAGYGTAGYGTAGYERARDGTAGYGTAGYERARDGTAGDGPAWHLLNPGTAGDPLPGSSDDTTFLGVVRGPVAGSGRRAGGRTVPAPRPVPDELVSASLVGRRAELAAVLGLIARPEVRLITVLGPGGVGKSRLVAEVVAVLRGAGRGSQAVSAVINEGSGGVGKADPSLITALTMDDRGRGAARGAAGARVTLVPLAGVVDAAQVPVEICRALAAVPDRRGEPAVDIAARALADGPAVIVLDDLAVPPAAALDGLVHLLEQARQLTVLITARAATGLRGERLLALGPLAVPAADPDPVAVAGSEAGRLFRERARAVRPAFEVTPANAAAVAALCRRLDGMPLALELAAARVRELPPAEILRRLQQRRPPRDPAAPARPDGMREVLDWSARLLDPAELLMFGQLSVFAGGWTQDGAEQVCGPVWSDEPALAEVLGRLADRGLVTVDGTGRTAMPGTVRDYAREVLAADPAVAAITRDRHAAHFAGLAEDLGPRSRGWSGSAPLGDRGDRVDRVDRGDRPYRPDRPDRRGLLDRLGVLDLEAGNLRLALEHAAGDRVAGDRVDGELLARLVTGLLDHWFAAGRMPEAGRWLVAARQADLSPASRARMLLSLGNLSLVGGDLPAAITVLAEAHRAARRSGDLLLAVRTGAAGAVAARYQGRPDRALAQLAVARTTLTDAGGRQLATAGVDLAGLERALQNEFGEVLDELGRGAEAVPLWLAGRRGAAAADDPAQLAYPLVNLARSASDRGARDEAGALMAQALAAAAASGSEPVRADVLAAAGLLDHRAGRPARALTRLRAAIRLGHDCGQLLPLPEVVAVLGSVLVRDQPAVAARLLAASASWRAQLSITIGRPARSVVAAAETDLLAAVSSGEISVDRVRTERERGAATPFGSLRGLFLLDPGLRASVVDAGGVPDFGVIDLRPNTRREGLRG